MEIGFPTSTRVALEKARRAAASAVFPDLGPFSAAIASAAAGTTYDAALTNLYQQTGSRLLQAVEFTGGSVTTFGSAYRLQVASAGTGNGNLTGGVNAWLGEMSFVVDTAAKVQIRLNGVSTSYYRIRVDGLYINFTPQAYAANSDNIVSIDLSPLPAGPHRITFELNNGVRVVGIAVAPTANVYRPSPAPDRVVALASGDSYSEGQGSTNQMNAWPKTMGRALGWADVRQAGLGGTGWLTSGGNGNFNFANQVATWPVVNPDIAMSAVDVVVIGHGYNDADPGSDTAAASYKALYDAVMLGLQRTRAMCPNAWIVVLGPWNGARGTVTAGSRGANLENCIRAAFAAWADGNSAFIPVSLALPQSWLTGTGRVGSTNSSGNTDAYISSDGVHPSDSGHVYLGMRAADGARSAMKAAA